MSSQRKSFRISPNFSVIQIFYNRGYTLVEVLVVIAILAILVALLLPAAQLARESARRTSCLANLRQIGLAQQNYYGVYNSFPSGSNSNAISSSIWIKLLPFLEQQSLYDCYNQSLSTFDSSNFTVRSTQLTVLSCPSDSGSRVRVSNEHTFATIGYGSTDNYRLSFFTSYVSSFGTTDTTAHAYPDRRGYARADGVVSNIFPLTYAAITDGTSNTFFVSERSTAYLKNLDFVNPAIFTSFGLYYRDSLGDTMFTTFYPPNMPKKVSAGAGLNHASAASSVHNSGLNMLMCDGSVRHIKDSISTWPFALTTGFPSGTSSGPGGYWNNLPKQGLWQDLTTRSGNEIGSDDL